jgi:hypothetical protein
MAPFSSQRSSSSPGSCAIGLNREDDDDEDEDGDQRHHHRRRTSIERSEIVTDWMFDDDGDDDDDDGPAAPREDEGGGDNNNNNVSWGMMSNNDGHHGRPLHQHRRGASRRHHDGDAFWPSSLSSFERQLFEKRDIDDDEDVIKGLSIPGDSDYEYGDDHHHHHDDHYGVGVDDVRCGGGHRARRVALESKSATAVDNVDLDFGLFGIDSRAWELEARMMTDETTPCKTRTTSTTGGGGGTGPPGRPVISAVRTANTANTSPLVLSPASPSCSSVINPSISGLASGLTTTSGPTQHATASVNANNAGSNLGKYSVSNFNATVADDSFPFSAFVNWQEKALSTSSGSEQQQQHHSSQQQQHQQPTSQPQSQAHSLYGRTTATAVPSSSSPSSSSSLSLSCSSSSEDNEAGGRAGASAGLHEFRSLAEATSALRQQQQHQRALDASSSSSSLGYLADAAMQYNGGNGGGGGGVGNGRSNGPPREFVPKQNIYGPAFPHRECCIFQLPLYLFADVTFSR